MFGIHKHPSELFPLIPAPLKRLFGACVHAEVLHTDEQTGRMWLQCVTCGRSSQGWDTGSIAPPVVEKYDGELMGCARSHRASQTRCVGSSVNS